MTRTLKLLATALVAATVTAGTVTAQHRSNGNSTGGRSEGRAVSPAIGSGSQSRSGIAQPSRPAFGTMGRPTSGLNGLPNSGLSGKPNPSGGGKPNPSSTGKPNANAGGTPNPNQNGKPSPNGDGKPKPNSGGKPSPNSGGKPNPNANSKPLPNLGGSINISVSPVFAGGGQSGVPADGGSGGGNSSPVDFGGGSSSPSIADPPVSELTGGSTLANAGISVSSYPPAMTAIRQSERYLKIKNNTGERLRVYVHHYSLTAGGEWVWQPARPGENVAPFGYNFEPGEEAVLGSGQGSLAAHCVRVWARSASGLEWTDYRNADLCLVPEQDANGDRYYLAADRETFTFSFDR
jgi:hypothetical protein